MEDTAQTFRTEMQCRGKRDNGDIFLANVFFSTYRTAMGPRLAALVVDASEDLRDRAEYGLEQLMAGSRILVGAVSHEVRNVCSAIAVMYENLARSGDLRKNQDFEALGSLVETLNKIASLELRKSTGGFEAKVVDLAEILDEARIVLEPYCAESDITVHWNIPEELPSVWTDRHSLLQVLLNLTKNSRRALEGASLKRIDVSVAVEHGIVSIRVCDTGPGIAPTEKLFQPLQKGADATGLGLFLSRAFMRSFGGDLRYDPEAPGCCFVIELAIAGIAEADQGERARMQRIRLLLVDDHPLFREGLARLLASEPDFEMVAQCSTATEALEVLSRSDIDIVLLDFDLGDEQGNHFISSSRQSGYTGKILMVTAGMSAKEASAALKLGASGILLKHSSPGTLANAIRLVAQGELWVDQKVIQQMADCLQGDQPSPPRALTQREDQVLQGVFEGLINKEIAAKIGVSEDSVKATLKQLFLKTGARTRSQLVLIALEGSFRAKKKL